ncbi:MAG: hypothetical protein WCY43_03300 [Patescibacteria group bacterium]|nr:hypothetical protein [Patescibacteria group bacterium]
MENNKKKIGKILIAILFILILLFIYFAFLGGDKKNHFSKPEEKIEEKTEQQKYEEMKAKSEVIYTFDEELERDREWSEEDFKKMAANFAERFGSYSSHGNYGNIVESKYLMTKEMKSWADSYVVDLKNNSEYSGEFYGMTSKVFVSPEIENFNPESGQVEVLVSTQRFETKDAGGESVFNQNIKINYIKEGGEWLVDSASWQ